MRDSSKLARLILVFPVLLGLLGLAPVRAAGHEDPPATASTPSTAPTVSLTDDAASTNIAKWAARFKGSTFVFDQSITPDTVAPDVQQSPVPSYQWWIVLRPRYYFTPKLSLRVKLDLTVEWLNAAETTLFREPTLGDTWVDLAYTGIPKFGGIESAVGVRLVLPTSKTTIMHSTVLGVTLTGGLSREFLTRAGDFSIALGGSAGYTFNTATSGGLVGNLSYDCQSFDFTHQDCRQNVGRMNTFAAVTGSLALKYTPPRIKGLSIGATYIIIDQWRYNGPSTTIRDATGGSTTVATGPNDQRLSETGWFLASIDYDVAKWLSLSLGYYTIRPVLDPISRYGNPFWSPGGNTRIFFTTTFALDAIFESAANRAARRRASVNTAQNPLPSSG